MSFLETVETVHGLLRSRGRLSFRVLRREFSLSDDALEDLVDELVEQGVARREGNALVVGAASTAHGIFLRSSQAWNGFACI